MLKNNKGFSLMEMLGAVAILGILTTLTIAGTTKYLNQTREKSYKIMSQSVYQATETCILQKKCNISDVITTDNLINNNFLKELKNPINSKPDCNGSITISTTNTSGFEKYTYKVKLICEGIKQTELTWPEARTN